MNLYKHAMTVTYLDYGDVLNVERSTVYTVSGDPNGPRITEKNALKMLADGYVEGFEPGEAIVRRCDLNPHGLM